MRRSFDELHALVNAVMQLDALASGESIQFQVLAHQGVQPVKTLAHVAASTPVPMRNRSPVVNTRSTAASVACSCRAALLSTKAKRTGSLFWRRLRQA